MRRQYTTFLKKRSNYFATCFGQSRPKHVAKYHLIVIIVSCLMYVVYVIFGYMFCPWPAETCSQISPNCNYCILFDVCCLLTVHNILQRFHNKQRDGLSKKYVTVWLKIIYIYIYIYIYTHIKQTFERSGISLPSLKWSNTISSFPIVSLYNGFPERWIWYKRDTFSDCLWVKGANSPTDKRCVEEAK